MMDRKKEIIMALETQGKLNGYKKTIARRNSAKYPYEIIHESDLFGTDSELYDNLEDALNDFIELEKIYG